MRSQWDGKREIVGVKERAIALVRISRYMSRVNERVIANYAEIG